MRLPNINIPRLQRIKWLILAGITAVTAHSTYAELPAVDDRDWFGQKLYAERESTERRPLGQADIMPPPAPWTSAHYRARDGKIVELIFDHRASSPSDAVAFAKARIAEISKRYGPPNDVGVWLEWRFRNPTRPDTPALCLPGSGSGIIANCPLEGSPRFNSTLATIRISVLAGILTELQVASHDGLPFSPPAPAELPRAPAETPLAPPIPLDTAVIQPTLGARFLAASELARYTGAATVFRCVVEPSGLVTDCAAANTPGLTTKRAVASAVYGAAGMTGALYRLVHMYRFAPEPLSPSMGVRTFVIDVAAIKAAPPLPPTKGILEEVPLAPHSFDNLANLYPPRAQREGRQGQVVVQCRILADYSHFCTDPQMIPWGSEAPLSDNKDLIDATIWALAKAKSAPKDKSGQDTVGYDVTRRINWSLPN